MTYDCELIPLEVSYLYARFPLCGKRVLWITSVRCTQDLYWCLQKPALHFNRCTTTHPTSELVSSIWTNRFVFASDRPRSATMSVQFDVHLTVRRLSWSSHKNSPSVSAVSFLSFINMYINVSELTPTIIANTLAPCCLCWGWCTQFNYCAVLIIKKLQWRRRASNN